MNFRFLLSLVAPPLCAGCNWPGKWLCHNCQKRVEYCLGPAYFRQPLTGLTQVWCMARYRPPVSQLIQLMKFDVCCPEVADWLGDWLAKRADLTVLNSPIITWVPCSPKNKKIRGFDQAERIARQLAKRCQVPATALLTRKASVSQHELHTKAERIAHAQGLFQPLPTKLTNSVQQIILVDDVCTTGQTLSQAAQVLYQQHGLPIVGLAVARD